MLSRKLVFVAGLLGLAIATFASIRSVSAFGLRREGRLTAVDGPKDPALERLLRRHRAQAIDLRQVGR